jgi:hypothetical protein
MTKDYFQDIIQILNKLHKAHPTYNVGRHLSTALDEYGDVWGMTNKELTFALEKYSAKLEMDKDYSEKELDEIIREGMNLDSILENENEEDEDY